MLGMERQRSREKEDVEVAVRWQLEIKQRVSVYLLIYSSMYVQPRRVIWDT